MSNIEGNITIYLDDFADPSQLINQIRSIVTSFNGRETVVNVVEMDDPTSTNPFIPPKG